MLAFVHPLQPVGAWPISAVGSSSAPPSGWFALRHTEFEATPQGYFYTPHLYIGIAVTALFIGRMLYRMVLVYGMGGAATSGSGPMAARTTIP